MRRISMRARAIRTSARTGANGPTTRCVSRRSALLPLQVGRGCVANFVPDVVHAHDWQARLGSRLSALWRRAASAHRDDRAQPGVPGPISGFAARHTRFAAARLGVGRRRVFRNHRLSQGRLGARRPHHHGVAELRGGDSHAGVRHGIGRPAAAPVRGVDRHPERHRHRPVESRHRPASAGPLRRQASCTARR